MVADGDASLEEARQHLSPRGPGFAVLIGDGGIAGEIDGDGAVRFSDINGADGGLFAVELERELMVPIEAVEFAGFSRTDSPLPISR